MAAALLTVVTAAGIAHASAAQPGQAAQPAQPGGPPVGPAPVGPAPVSPLGHPRLCWQAEGNGSSVTLEACNTAIQGQLWTFTGNGIVMNGNGYCLQNGTASPGQAPPLFLSFSGQCAGAASQTWKFSGVTNAIRNPAAGVCARAQGGAYVPGAQIIALPCGSAATAERWSFGVSDLRLSAPRGRVQLPGQSPAAGGSAATSGKRAFTAQVTVANGAKAMTAYDASVSLRLPHGLTATRLTGTGSLSSWTCTVRTLRCRGNLAGGFSGLVTVSGTVTSRPAPRSVTVRATVARTNESRHDVRRVTVPVRVLAAVAAGTGGGVLAGGPHGPAGGRVATYAIVAGLLVLVGIVLAVVTRRQPRPRAPYAAASAQAEPTVTDHPAADDPAAPPARDEAPPYPRRR
jgi:hypothetical protein